MRKCKLCGCEIIPKKQTSLRKGRVYTRVATNKKYCDSCKRKHVQAYNREYRLSGRKQEPRRIKKEVVMVDAICPYEDCGIVHKVPAPSHSRRYCPAHQKTVYHGIDTGSNGYEGYAQL